MKKWLRILLVAVILVLALSVMAACDPDKSPKSYTITFVSNGGSAVESITAKEGEDISEKLPTDPTMSSLYFKCWSKEDNGFSSTPAELPTEMPSENVTYYAIWARHYTVVPMLQSLNADGTPASSYEEAPDLAAHYEADPEHPAVDLHGKAPSIVGFEESSAESEYSKTVNQKDETFTITYDRKLYYVEFNANLSSAQGSMEEIEIYFGQPFELPAFGFTTPEDTRFAGWMTSPEGGNFAADGAETKIGDGFIDGAQTSLTLYATYDKGYVDYSYGEDYVFIPSHEEGVAVVRRLGVFEQKGSYTANQNGGANDYLGEFEIENEAGTKLVGRVYPDGHFSYQNNSLATSIFNISYPGLDIWRGVLLEGTSLVLNDDFGSATLTLGEPIEVLYDGIPLREYVQIPAGEYAASYWKDPFNNDFGLTLLYAATEGAEALRLDLHFNVFDMQLEGSNAKVRGFGFRGNEAGMFYERLENDTPAGELILIDGYGGAVLYDLNDDAWEGLYARLDNGDIIVSVQNDTNTDRKELLIRPEYLDYIGTTLMRMAIMQYERGDITVLANCQNEDGSSFACDGFGEGTYIDAQGNETRGSVQIVAPLFDEFSSAIVYVLNAPNKKLSLMVDNGSANGNFVVVEGDVEVDYLFNTSAFTNDYIGAIARVANGDAYYFTKRMTSSGGTVFTAPVKGRSESKGSGYLFTSDEFIISFEDDAELSHKNGVPTVKTSQLQLNELVFAVKDLDGEAAGQFTVGSDGKAKYVGGSKDFEGKTCEFAYGAISVEGEGLFVVDSFGESPLLLLTQRKVSYIADYDYPNGIVYEFYSMEHSDLGNDALYWQYDGDEPKFYDACFVGPDDNDTYIIVFSDGRGYIAIDGEKDGEQIYICSNSSLRSGTYSNGGAELKLDQFGRAEYTNNGKTFKGTYGIENGTYKLTLEGEGAPEPFNFAISRSTFTVVTYMELLALDAASLNVTYIIRIDREDMRAYLYRPAGSGLDVERGNSLGEGSVTVDSATHTYAYVPDDANSALNFRFYLNESILGTNAAFIYNDSLLEGSYGASGTSRNIELDKYGRATYTDEEGATSEGYYCLSGNRYRYRDFDGNVDVLFTIDASNALVLYDPDASGPESGRFALTLNGEEFALEITYETLDVKLYKGDTLVLQKTATLDDGIYSFSDIGNDGEVYSVTFMIDGDELVQYSDELAFSLDIISGNLYLYEMGIERLECLISGKTVTTDIVMRSGSLRLKGFMQAAELTTAAGTVKGSVKSATFDGGLSGYIFTAENGSTQELVLRGEGQGRYLVAFGAEKANAYNVFIVGNSLSTQSLFAFDGLGRVSGGAATQVYYVFGANPYAADESLGGSGYIYVGALNADRKLSVEGVYKPYLLSVPVLGITPEIVVGLVKYNPLNDRIIVADDGSVFVLDGYDEVEFIDSLGMSHSGNFNNNGEMSDSGEHDSTYVFMDELGNVSYYIVSDGTSGVDHAKRRSYVIYFSDPVLAENVYAEIHLVDKQFYEEFAGQPFPQEQAEMDGYAALILVIGSQKIFGGYYEFENGMLLVHIERIDEVLEMLLYVDGFAEWLNPEAVLEY